MLIGERVLELIKEKGITQKAFSDQTGIPQSTISDWRNKKVNPSSDKIMIICDVLNVTPYDILSGNSDNNYAEVDYMIIGNNEEERNLIEKYRDLSDKDKGRLWGYLDALSNK